MSRQFAALCAVFALAAAPAQATELFGGLYGHDVTFIGETIGSGAAGREEGWDIHLGARSKPIAALARVGRPQAHAFVSLNSEKTSNFAAAGLSWRIGVSERFYVRPGLGMGITDGKAKLPPVNQPGIPFPEILRRLKLYNTRIDFGSKVLFEPELAVGWQVTPRLAAELSWVHFSHGQILHQGKNQGIDLAGLRLVYSLAPGR